MKKIIPNNLLELHAKPLRTLSENQLNRMAEFYNKPEVKRVIDDRVKELRGKVVKRNDGNITYDGLSEAHQFVWNNFIYTPDDTSFGYTDFWNTLAFDILIYTGELHDDCDGFGMCLLEMLYRVYDVSKDNMKWSACTTETGEGHFVDWIKCSDGITYQAENRWEDPKTVKFFKDMGYWYNYYASMNNPMKLLIADDAVKQLLLETPANIASDKARFKFRKIFQLHKSKTLIKEWLSILTGSVLVLKDNANEVVDTLQANEANLSQFLDKSTLGFIMVVLSFIGLYLRAITDKDIEAKKDIDG